MPFFRQPAHKNVYRSWLALFFGVGWELEVIQLVMLRASERYQRTLRNTVEVHHIDCVLCNS